MTKKKDDAKEDERPWTKGTNVKGVVPPGRRLDKTKSRKTRWSATGVSGVTPPGKLKPDEGPSVDWVEKEERRKEKKTKDNKRQAEKAKSGNAKLDPMRPIAGFKPNALADVADPTDMKSFLKPINDFLDQKKPSSDLAQAFASLITQSHAPFDILIGFTILSALIGKSTQLRRRYAVALERGAKVYFNLLQRLEKNVQVPRGLVPETVNALFYDLPQAALSVPYAYATSAFLRQMELLRDSFKPELDQAIVELGQQLFDKFIAGRSLGDMSLAKMFPYTPPEW